MGYSFDNFVAAMKCFNCGRVSPADESTDMQTYLRDDPQLENLGVGSFVGNSFNEMRDKHYLEVKSMLENKVVLLTTWVCPYCFFWNWAKITIVDGFIVDIISVKLEKAVFEETNFIHLNAVSDAMELSGYDYSTVRENGIVETLTKELV